MILVCTCHYCPHWGILFVSSDLVFEHYTVAVVRICGFVTGYLFIYTNLYGQVIF